MISLKAGYKMTTRAINALVEATGCSYTRYIKKNEFHYTYNLGGHEFAHGGAMGRHLLKDINDWMLPNGLVDKSIILNAHMNGNVNFTFFEEK